MEPVIPKSCDQANCSAILRHRASFVRRGERVVEVDRQSWVCAACMDPDTGEPYEFVDAALGEANESAAREAWRARYGEVLPPARPPGRKPKQPRRERVTVLMSMEEASELDQLRGGKTRSDFIRESVRRRRDAT